MKARKWIIILGLIVIVMSTLSAQADINKRVDPTSEFFKLQLATAQIGAGGRGGAGVIIKDDREFLYIATARHIANLKGKMKIVIRRKDLKQKIIAKIPRKNIYKDKILDVAIIKVSRPEGEFEVVTLAIKSPSIGKTVYTVGHPSSFTNTINKGIVSNYLKNPVPKRKGIYMLISAPSFTGNSGGAVINVNKELVGIASGIMWLGDNPKDLKHTLFLYHLTFVVRIEDIKNLLETVK